VITTVITLALMLPTAVYVHLRLPRLRRLLEGITILPIVIPPVVLIVGVLQIAPGALKGTPYLLALVYARVGRRPAHVPAGGDVSRLPGICGTMNRLPGELNADRVLVLGADLPVKGDRPAGPGVDVLVRPEGLRMTAVTNGNGIVTTATFLGSLTRVGVLLSGDVTVLVDQPSADAAAMPPGTSVEVSVVEAPVLVTTRR
jgi:hypothetical protein